EVAVGRADAVDRLVKPAEGVLGAAEAGCATAGAELAPGILENLVDRLLAWCLGLADHVEPQHVRVYFGRSGDDKGRDLDLAILEDRGCEDHVGDLAAGAGSDVGAVDLDVPTVTGG